MKPNLANVVPVALVSVALLWPAGLAAQTADQNAGSASAEQMNAPQTAHAMVRGMAALTKTLDARKAQPGSQFEAKLERTVHLKNGPELPKGSVLMGEVGSDDMNQSGNSKLALQFTEARLKDGNMVPIKATIVEVYPPQGFDASGAPIPQESASGTDADANPWNSKTFKIDQIGALSGVDLHSNITSRNSGVFVTTKKDDVKLQQGSQLALAIAPQGTGSQGQNGGTR